MKRTSYPRFLARAAMTLLAVLFSFTGARADVVEIGDGGATNNQYLPGYNYYNYSWTQQIYTADEIGTAGTINSIAFKNTGAEKTRTYSIYMAHTDKENFADGSDWVAMSEDNLVFSGELTFTVDEWTTIELDNPFVYDGSSNLIVAVADNTGSYSSSPHMACLVFNATSKAIRAYRDASAYDITAPGVTGTVLSVKNQIQLDITPGSGTDCERPTNLVATEIDAHSATLTWASEVGSYNIEYKKASLPNDDVNWTSIEGDIELNEFTLTGLEQNTAYNARVRAVCDPDEGVYSGWRTVIFTTPVSCPAPTALAVTLTPGDGSVATLSWTENGSATSWQICLNDDETNLTDADSNPFKLTKLTPETAYTAKVRAVGDGETSSWSESITFTPTDAYSITVNDGTNTNSQVPLYGTWVDTYSKSQFIIPADDLADMTYGTINKLTFYAQADKEWGAAEFEVYMTEVNNTSFESASLVDWTTMEKVMNAGSLAIVGNKMEITLDKPYQYQGGNLLIGILQTTSGTWGSCAWYGVTTEDNVAIGGYESSKGLGLIKFLPKTTFDYTPGEQPACPKPTRLAVNYEGGTEATISWTSDATAWNLSVNGVETSITENPYTLTNLDLATTYEVKVQAACSENETSDWTNTVSFTTDNCMPEDMITVNYTLNDTYGDGWNNNYILVVDENCNIVEMLTIENGSSATGTVKVCGSVAQFMWYAGSYANETSWSFTDAEGNVLFEGAGNASMQDFDLLYLIDKNPYSIPTDIAVSEVGPRSAKVAWTETGNATAWQIAIYKDEDEPITVDADSNPFTITGLDPETEYYVTVRAAGPNGTSNWSCLGAEFTTDVAAPVPTNLVANRVNANSATLNWEGPSNATTYNVRYGKAADVDPSTPATIILTAPSLWTDGSGYQMLLDADATAYGTIIPESGGLTSSGDASAETYAEFEYKIPGNADGSLTTSNIVLNNRIAIEIPAGTYDWCITNPTPGDRVWIASSNGNVPGRYDDFVFEPGVTYEFTLSMYGDYDGVDLITTAPVEWITVEGVTSPYQLTDLDPSTDYYWQVQANCGEEDGLSQWSSTATFTTGSYSDAPTELAATATSSTATLEWTGSQNSYNVRYRVTSHGGVLAEQNFDDSSLGNWTTIDADGDGYGWVLGSAVGGVYLAEGGSLAGNGHNDSAELLTSGSYSNVFGALTPDNYLVSPQVDLGGSISFYAQAQDPSYAAEHFGVAVSTTGNTDADDFTTIAEWTMNADGTGTEGSKAGEWGIFTVDLSNYAGQQGYVAIRHFDCSDQFLLNIDDIVIEGPAGAETEWTELTVSDNSVEIDGLESNTEYEWQVRGILDEGTTNWTIGVNFTTLPLIELANDAVDNSALIGENKDVVADVTLVGRTLVKDGNWNTICLPFDVELEGSPLEGATAKTLANASITGSHVSLTFGDAVTTLDAGVPYIIKWETSEESEENIVDPTFTGVTIKEVDEDVHTVSPIDGVKFIGYYDAFDITPANENIYYMTAGNELKHTGKARTLKACRAYFDFSESAVRGFTLNFGDSEATGIVSIDNEQLNNESGWYTVDGKKLEKQPTRKGVYINNGIKVVIK